MTCAQGLLRLLWGGAEVGVLRDCNREQVNHAQTINDHRRGLRSVNEVINCSNSVRLTEGYRPLI